MKSILSSGICGLAYWMKIGFLFGFFFFTYSLSAQEPVSVTLAQNAYLIESRHLAIFKDTSQTLTIDEIIQEVPPQKWEVPDLNNPSVNDFQSTYWVKIEFEGKPFLQKEWFIESLVSHTDHERFNV